MSWRFAAWFGVGMVSCVDLAAKLMAAVKRLRQKKNETIFMSSTVDLMNRCRMLSGVTCDCLLSLIWVYAHTLCDRLDMAVLSLHLELRDDAAQQHKCFTLN